ncbi:MAG: glycosyltransferase [Candidatus Omnitrophica bacterium]|nr:glycosyltransferase [Candidatus Omnitrophota bacterium]MBU1871965.1 glycosyltransferase [Candidatus Omnitrophota bacterium]
MVEEIENQGSKHYALPVHKKSVFTVLWMIPRLMEIIRKEKIDIVHARSRVPAWIAFFACRLTGALFITTCHGYYGNHFASRPMGWGKLVICPSQIIANHMIKDFGLPLEKIRLVPRGLDLEKFKFILPDKKEKKQPGVFNIGIIGRLSPIKGHPYFLRAIARVLRKVSSPAIKIWIVGDASSSHQAYKHELEVLVKRLGLVYCTEFLGTQKDIPSVLADLNLLVLASVKHEAFGRVVIEAQAAGVPVIAARVGGVVDIIDDETTGILVTPADIDGLGKAIIRIIKDTALANSLAEKAYRKVKEKFTLEIMAENTLAVYQEALSRFKILVIKLSALGDVVLISPSLRAIRKKFPKPDYKISLLVHSPYQEVFFNCPYIDELIVCDFKDKDKGLKGFIKLSHELRKRNFDFSIDLQNNNKSHLLACLSFIPRRYGYKRKLGFLLSNSLPVERMSQGPVKHQSRLLNLLDIETEDSSLELWPGKEDEEFVEDFLNQHWLGANQVLVGMNLSASRKWITKAWPQEYVVRLCEELTAKDIRMVFTGEISDLPWAREMLELFKNAKPIIACGKTSVNQLAALIKRCRVFISADSAPLHICAAVGSPYVALFGPTDPVQHSPVGHKGIIIYKNLSCSPCYKSICARGHECMSAIRPQEVMEAVEKLLDKN